MSKTKRRSLLCNIMSRLMYSLHQTLLLSDLWKSAGARSRRVDVQIRPEVFCRRTCCCVVSLVHMWCACTVKEGLEEAPRALKPPNIQSWSSWRANLVHVCFKVLISNYVVSLMWTCFKLTAMSSHMKLRVMGTDVNMWFKVQSGGAMKGLTWWPQLYKERAFEALWC